MSLRHPYRLCNRRVYLVRNSRRWDCTCRVWLVIGGGRNNYDRSDTFHEQRRDRNMSRGHGLLLYIPSLLRYYIVSLRVLLSQTGRLNHRQTISSTTLVQVGRDVPIYCKCVLIVLELDRLVSLHRLVSEQVFVSLLLELC